MIIDDARWLIERIVEYSFASFASWGNFSAAIWKVFGTFTDLESGTAWPYLLSSLFIAAGLFVWKGKSDVTRTRSFRAFLFPPRIFLDASAVLDYKFYAIDLFMRCLFYVPVLAGIGVVGFKLMSALLVGMCSWDPPSSLSPAQAVGAMFGLFLLHDLINYWTHVLFHKVPALWAFHQVHHSAEVLTPFTAYRTHPMETFIPAVLQMPVVGLASVFFHNIPLGDMQIATIGGIGIFTVTCSLIGFHLRHSHIWLSFGPVLSRLYISPAQHQIHHSTDPRHLDKNFGVRLAVWDAIFCTLYVPQGHETLRVGLPDGNHRDFKTVGQLYGFPFVKALRALNGPSRDGEEKLITGCAPARALLLNKEGR